MDYKTWETTQLAPGWLRGPVATKLLGVLGYAKDLLAGAAKLAIKSRWPATAPTDAYGAIGAGMNLERYAADTNASYLARLAQPWTIWDAAGTAGRILAALNQLGYPTVRLYSWRDSGQLGPTPYETYWSEFQVIIDLPHPAWTDDGTWGSGGTWGDGDATRNGGVWGSSATTDEVRAIRAAVKKWKPAEQICSRIVVILSGEIWEPVLQFGSGTWGGAATIVWSGV